MSELVTLTRENGTKLQGLPNDQIVLAPGRPGSPATTMTPDDLHWLVTTGGPAMIALLGGPIEGRGIKRVGVLRG